MIKAILIFFLLGSTAMAKYNLERMKKLAKLSGVPLERILKFQLQESSGGNPEKLAGDKGMSGGDLHLHKKTALNLTNPRLPIRDKNKKIIGYRPGLMANKKLYDKINSLKTTPGKGQVSEYTTWLVENEQIQDKLLLTLLKDTKRMANQYVKKIFNREPSDEEHYAFWNASPAVAQEGIATHFKSKDPKVQRLQRNIEHFKKRKGSYLDMDKKPSKSFKQTFDEAREAGKKEFSWRGKRYHTRLKEEDEGLAKEQKKIIQESKKPEQNIEVEDIELEETIPVDQSVPYGVYAGGEPEYYQSEQDQFWTGAEGGEVKKYDNGGEVVDEYEDSWMRSNDEEVIDEYDDSWMRDYLIESTPEYIKSPEYQEGVATVPGIPGFVPQPEPKIETEEIDVKSVVKKYVEGGKTYEDRKQIIALISDGKTTREEVSSLIKQFDRPEPEDMVAQGGRDPRTPPGPMMREALGLGKEPTKEPRGASGTWEEDKVVKDTTTQAAPGKNLRKLTKKEFLDIRQLQDEKKLREAEDAAIAQAMKAATIDPNRFYKNQSTFNKIVSLVGLAAGAYGASKYGTPNVFIKRLDDAVKKDIEAQKLGQTEEGKKLAAANFKVAVLARRLARSTKEIDKRNTLEKLSLSYQKKGEKAAKKLAQKDYNQLLLEAVNTRGLTDKELSIISVNLPKMKIEQSVIKGRDGLNYYVKGGVSRANKVKEYVANAQQTIDGLNDLIGYVDKVSFLEQGTFNPFGALFSQDRAEAESLRDRLVGNLRIEFFGPGVMTDQEREQAKKILGDPNRLFTTDEREIAKIRNLMMKVNYGVRQKLRSDGVALPVSPNERRIAQMLKRRNLSNVPVNRRKVVDQLIFQEKEHVEKGGTPGKWWDPSEPLAV